MVAREARDMRIKLNDASHHPGTWAAASETIEQGEGITRIKARSMGCLLDTPRGRPDDPHDRTDRDGGRITPGSTLLESRMKRKFPVRFGGGRQKRGRKATALTAHPITWTANSRTDQATRERRTQE